MLVGIRTYIHTVCEYMLETVCRPNYVQDDGRNARTYSNWWHTLVGVYSSVP
jgi:hypothetical protein